MDAAIAQHSNLTMSHHQFKRKIYLKEEEEEEKSTWRVSRACVCVVIISVIQFSPSIMMCWCCGTPPIIIAWEGLRVTRAAVALGDSSAIGWHSIRHVDKRSRNNKKEEDSSHKGSYREEPIRVCTSGTVSAASCPAESTRKGRPAWYTLSPAQ